MEKRAEGREGELPEEILGRLESYFVDLEMFNIEIKDETVVMVKVKMERVLVERRETGQGSWC